MQELLAPKPVQFFGSSWGFIAERDNLSDILYEITGIPPKFLDGDDVNRAVVHRECPGPPGEPLPGEKVWHIVCSGYQSRSLLYGESDKAFLRLQEAICQTTDDQSLFAWGLIPNIIDQETDLGIFAKSPQDFDGCGEAVQCRVLPYSGKAGFELIKSQIRFNIPIILSKEQDGGLITGVSCVVGVLDCRLASDPEKLLGIPALRCVEP